MRKCGCVGKTGQREMKREKSAGEGADIHQYPLMSLKCWSLDINHYLLPFSAEPLEIEAESFPIIRQSNTLNFIKRKYSIPAY